MRFANPYFLLLLIIIPLLIWHDKKRVRKNVAAIFFPDAEKLAKKNTSLKAKLFPFLRYVRYCSLILLVIAFSRPQAGQKSEEIRNQGIDIIIVLDTSTSMRAIDFEPDNRLEAAKKVADMMASEYSWNDDKKAQEIE